LIQCKLHKSKYGTQQDNLFKAHEPYFGATTPHGFVLGVTLCLAIELEIPNFKSIALVVLDMKFNELRTKITTFT
jgi:hypothetical protein